MLKWFSRLAGKRAARAAESIKRVHPTDADASSLSAPLLTTTDIELNIQLARYKWYHTIRLTPSISTPGAPAFIALHPPVLRQMDKVDFRGKRVIDIGCRDGLFSFEAERRGAGEVMGIDSNLSRGAIEMLIPFFKSRIQMRAINLFDLSPDEHGMFDIVLFPGVLYHLRYPFTALKILSDLMANGARMIIETGIFADNEKRALLFCPTGKERPYDRSSVTFFNRKGLVDSLCSFGLRTDAIDYQSAEDRARADHSIIRGTFLCTKDTALATDYPHQYWSGGARKNWQKAPV